jgi:hypothetical protein
VIDVVLLWVLRVRKPNKDSAETANENSNYIDIGNLIYDKICFASCMKFW